MTSVEARLDFFSYC